MARIEVKYIREDREYVAFCKKYPEIIGVGDTKLEALENIKHYDTRVGLHEDDYNIIETALKDSEMEHTLRVRLENINYELVREKQANEKKLKALEIIKEKEVDVALINNCNSVEEYNECLLKDYAYDTEAVEPHVLDKYEFDLLKEVLK